VSGVTVVVDLGVTDTVGVLRGSGAGPRPVVVDGATRVPTAVALSPDHQLVVGREAVGLATTEPDRVVRDLKSRLDRHDLMVGDIVLPVTRLVRTLLSRVVRSAGTRVDELVLTHPAGWPDERVEVLTRAAEGLAPAVRTVVAPLAAAAGAELDSDQTLLVVELDGDSGTASTVRVKSGKFSLVSTVDLPVDGELAKLAHSADDVLVVGRSGRAPVLARRLAEMGCAVRFDQDPATAVARGALRLLERRAARSLRNGRSVAPASSGAASSGGAPAARVPAGRPWLRRAMVSAAGLVIVAALATMLALGWGPGLRTAGSPGPAAGALVDPPAGEDAMPPEVEGRETVTGGQPAYTAARLGVPARYRTAVGAELQVAVKEVRATSSVSALGAAPAGYRWLIVEVTGTNATGPGWEGDLSRSVSVVDDRGLWIRPLGDGVVQCRATTPKPPKTLAPGKSFDGCVALPVPERTPVTAVVFGSVSSDADETPPVRVPVAIRPVLRAKPVTPHVVGKVGEPPVEVRLADSTMRAGFDVVVTPSGYVGDRHPAPGNRFVVVRATLGSADDVFLRDDRGVLSPAQPGFDRMPDCPPFTGPGGADRPVYACFVYEVDADARVAGVTYGDLAPDAALSGSNLEDWPTWTEG
jgi:hypothetical protein